jgi:hypothetical protein
MKGGIRLLSIALLAAQSLIAQSESAATRPRVPGAPPARPAASLVQPPVETWASPRAFVDALESFAQSLPPSSGGALLAGVIVTFLVAGRFRPFRLLWNLDLVMLLLPALFLVDIIARWAHLIRTDYGDEVQRGVFTLQFTALFALLAWWVLRGLGGALFAPPREWTPNLGRPVLVTLVAVLVLWNALTVLVKRPDDCGVYSTLGAQRMLERGTWPYGDEKLRGGAGATYGPVFYATHLAVLEGFRHPGNDPDADPDPGRGYQLPPLWPTKAICLAFHLLGLASLYAVGRRLAGVDVALALVALYAGSPYVFGLGGPLGQACGLTYISHIVPSALVLAALAVTRAPVLSGALLALGAGTVYYPAFFFPSMLGYFTTARKGAALRFAIGFVVVGAILAGSVILWTDRTPEKNAVRLFFESTLDHQESDAQYGMSPFGFFGVHPEIAAKLHRPLFNLPGLDHASPVTKPMFLLLAGLSLAGFALARNRRPAQLAMLLGAIAAAVQLWKTQATGTYVEWYYPLFLIGLLADRPSSGIVSSVGREGPPAAPKPMTVSRPGPA